VQQRVHESISQRAAEIVIPSPTRPRDDLPLQSDEEPLGASDADFSSDMSDTDYRLVADAANAQARIWRGKARPNPPVAIPQNPQPQQQQPVRRKMNGIRRDPRTPEQPPDDFYAELNVVSDCPTSEDDGR
jgi:hypothetical protein